MVGWRLVAALLIAGCAPAGGASPPAELARSGAELLTRLKAARGGEVIRLAPGDYGDVVVPARFYSPAIRIDAAGARFGSIRLARGGGVHWHGGEISGQGARSWGFTIRQANDVRIERVAFSRHFGGVLVDRSEDVAIVNNRFVGLQSEGIDMALSRRVQILGNVCRDFAPALSVLDAAGNMVRDGHHPDCIQAWSRPTAPPSADLTIVGNDIEGQMQGIFLGNHVRQGIDDGGFDRVVIRDNRIRVAMANGIAVFAGRDSAITGNTVASIPGSFHRRRPTVPVKTVVRVTGERNRVCGNQVADVADRDSEQPCR